MNSQNPNRRTLTKEERLLIVHLYCKEGLSKSDIAARLDVHRSTIDWWIKDIVRDKKPHKPKYLYTYDDYLKKEEIRKEKKKQMCTHPLPKLVVICRDCGSHLEETKLQPARVIINYVSI